ncbi:MAG: hypothetical protein WCV62_02845 [Candidatus Peribacteraceae bacterium]
MKPTVLAFLFAMLLPGSSSALYEVPGEREKGGMMGVVEQGIPRELEKANCGFRVPGEQEDDYMTKVYGVPLRPATWRDRPTGEDTASNPYPETAEGLVFSAYWWHDACRLQRESNPPCSDPQGCVNYCQGVNDAMRYKVYRATACEVHIADFAEDEAGNSVFVGCHTEIHSTDNAVVSADCHSCPGSSPECAPTKPIAYAYVGEKYQCTGDWDEEHDAQWMGSETGSILHADFGWVWTDGKPDVRFPREECAAFWTKGEDHEHRNCMPCTGDQCRSLEGRSLRPEFDPPKDLYGDIRLYDSLYRRYTATHDLAEIPRTQAPEEEERDDIRVQLACYNWYREKTLNPDDPSHRTCIADDLQLEKLRTRTVEDDVEWNADDALPSGENAGGFTLDPEGLTTDPRKAKGVSRFNAPALPPTDPVPPFGETSKYVTVLQRLERQMEGFPPTVELILPLVSSEDELARLFGPRTSAAARDITSVTVPLQAGLLDAVREILRQAVFARAEEDVVPVVVPLLSESEIQTVTEAWQGWKEQRRLLNLPVGEEVDALLAKLGRYREQITEFRALRAALPNALATVLNRRESLSDAIDAWVASRMAPYQALMGQEGEKRELFDAWRELKEAAVRAGQVNATYCKADRTTPPLRAEDAVPAIDWIELEKEFPLPAIPPSPRHLVFDFSDIFYEGMEDAAALRIPVLKPVQVAINLPLPPSPQATGLPPSLPDLPTVPPLPGVSAPPAVSIEARYGAEPAGTTVSYRELTEKFRQLAGDLRAVRDRYDDLIWVEEKHPDLACPVMGTDGCVFPETMLWRIFMRIWSPVGAFLDNGTDPAGTASSLSSAPSCPYPGWEDVDQCLLQEKLIRQGLRITLPAGTTEGTASSLADLRRDMRDETLNRDGSLVPMGPAAPPFDIVSPSDLYESYPVPGNVRLELNPAASASSSSSSRR